MSSWSDENASLIKMIKISRKLSIPAVANIEYAKPSLNETSNSGGWRIIKANPACGFADLYFKGFTIENERTVLVDPHLKLFNPEETTTNESFLCLLAQAILADSFDDIGTKTVERSC